MKAWAIVLAGLGLWIGASQSWALLQAQSAPSSEPAAEAPAADNAAQQPAAPAEQAATPEQAAAAEPDNGPPLGELKITIVAVQGKLAQVRTQEEEPWQPAQVGMVLGQGADLRTGPRSMIQFVIQPDHVVTLDRIGTIRVLQAFRNPEKIVVDLGMKYGRVDYAVEAGGLEHESTIRSPGATLAVRSTDVMFDNNPAFDPLVVIESDTDTTFTSTQLGTTTRTSLRRGRMSTRDRGPGDNARDNSTQVTNLQNALQNDENSRINQMQLNGTELQNLQDIRQQTTLDRLVRSEDRMGIHTTTYNPLGVRIFDTGFEDGDIIKVFFNNILVASHLTLTNTGQVFNLNLLPGNNYLLLEDVFSPEGNGRRVVGAVETLDGSNQFYDFEMNFVGDQRLLTIVAPDETHTVTSPGD